MLIYFNCFIINIILHSLSFSRFVDLKNVWCLFFFFHENQENFIYTQPQCHRKIFEDWSLKIEENDIFSYIHQHLNNTLEKYETSLRIDETFEGMEHQVQLENFMVGRLAEFQGRNGNDRNSFCRVSLFVRSSSILSHQVRIRRHKFLRETGRGRGDVERGQIAVEIESEEDTGRSITDRSMAIVVIFCRS